MSEKGKTNNKMDWTEIKEKAEFVRDWLLDHSKIVGPAVLIVCLAVTIIVALSAGEARRTEETEAAALQTQSETADRIEVPDTEMQENAVPEINELMVSYYKALADGDTDMIQTLVSPTSESYLVKTQEVGKYIDSYPSINIYTKPGPITDSYMVYVYTEVQMTGYAQYVPGLSTFYVCSDENGNYYINIEEELEEKVADYINAIDLQDDVIDLNNKVTVEFNDLLAQDPSFKAYYTELSNQITASVGDTLSETEEAVETEETETTEAGDAEALPANTTIIVRTTDVVNMRMSDSEKADKVDKAQVGDTFTLLEEKSNGWSKVLYNNQEVFIKSQYLEVVSQTENTATPAETQAQSTTNVSLGSSGYVTAKTTVNIRKSASETGERLGTIYQGEKLELVMNQADGWCKVKYKGQTGYVKSEFVE